MPEWKLSQDEANYFWQNWFMNDAFIIEKVLSARYFRMLPHDPRCKFCMSPFEGVGGLVMRSFANRRRSAMNPNFCNVCEEFALNHPGGANVSMAMLFVDIRGSTELSGKLGVNEFRALINRFFVEAGNVIAAHDGLLEKLQGDAVAAFWGAGFAGQNYVSRTIQAGLDILKVMQEQQIPVGAGIHCGNAYFGAMGTPGGLISVSAIGDEVNAAARIASVAAAGELLVSEKALEWAKLSGKDFEARSLTSLKGISAPIAVRVMKP